MDESLFIDNPSYPSYPELVVMTADLKAFQSQNKDRKKEQKMVRFLDERRNVMRGGVVVGFGTNNCHLQTFRTATTS